MWAEYEIAKVRHSELLTTAARERLARSGRRERRGRRLFRREVTCLRAAANGC